MYLEGFLSVITDPEMYLVILLGVAVGIVFGAIPGLTATMAITMCLPMTYAMETKTAVCVLMALYIGGISGGLISAILLNIPGTPSSLATTFDGAPMAASGHAKKALGVGVFYSFIGTMVGLVILMGVAPQLSKIAIKFSPLEYCALAIFSLVLVIALAGKDMIKGLTGAVTIMGLVVIGCMIPSTVKIKIPLTFAYGDATQSVQSILDAIFPYLLPVLVTFGVYKGLGSKKMTTVRMVWLIIIICIVLSFFGIL